MKDKFRKNIKRFFQIDFIYIKSLIVATLLIIIGIIGIVLYLTENPKEIQKLAAGIFMIVSGTLIWIFRKRLNNWMT